MLYVRINYFWRSDILVSTSFLRSLKINFLSEVAREKKISKVQMLNFRGMKMYRFSSATKKMNVWKME